MIKRSFLVFVLLAAAYALFIHFVDPDWDTTQHLQNGNRIKAEEFLFSPDDPQATVIVGSSLAYRIELDSLPKNTWNLGFGGLSIYDGLELINRAGRTPGLVLIETNVLFRSPDEGFLDALFEPGLYHARRSVPIMREENQPSGVLYGWIRRSLLKNAGTDRSEEEEGEPNQVMLQEHRTNYALLPAKEEQEIFMGTLRAGVNELEKRGVKVVFFEIPIHEELEEMPLSELGRDLIATHFPDHAFLRIERRKWNTTDGLHLAKREAHVFSGELARWIESLQ